MRLPSFARFISLPRKPSREERMRIALAFNSWVLYYLLEIIHKEFLTKSSGGVDSLGVKWLPLSESRRLYKPLRRGERTQFKIGRKKGTKKELLAGRDPPINIDTSRLINSLRPGRVVSGRYVAINEDQRVQVTSTTIRFDIKIPYADDVQEVRPYLPFDLSPWMNEAIEKAVPQLRTEIRSYVSF